MTSEVVVMNSLGVALATDSAATVYIDGRAKVYHADKLFMLSHFHPVGAMVYNNSALLGVPWETILKMFRKDLGKRAFGSLAEYGDHLIEYLNAARGLFPREVQDKYYLDLVETLYNGIESDIQERRDEIWRSRGGKDDGQDAPRIADLVIGESWKEWQEKPDATCFDPKIGSSLAGRMSGEITMLRNSVFKHLKLGSESSRALHELAALVVSKEEILFESRTGLVIAGFGEDEHMPVLNSYELGEVFVDNLKFKKVRSQQVDSKTPSVVETFAEREMVSTYLDGISPRFSLKILEDISELVLGLTEEIVTEVPNMSAKRKREFLDRILPKGSNALRQWWQDFEEFRLEGRQPFLQSISLLPKNELAHVAASLVSLTSFQKRMSTEEDETVGGPVDVAVISKGDGFVWIERKHYFRPELNRHFFKNYGVQNDADKSEGA